MVHSLALVTLLAGAAFAAVPADGYGNNHIASRSLPLGLKIGLNPSVNAETSVAANPSVDLAASRRQAEGFKCPEQMSYCPWTKSCSCSPGMTYDLGSKQCSGQAMTGAWPEPSVEPYSSGGAKLGTYCASSPYRIVKYDAKHEYCQANLNNIAFVANLDLAVEIGAYIGLDIDVGAKISAGLKSLCAGLAGLYVGDVVDAVVLFNTNAFGHGVVNADVSAGINLNLLGTVSNILCGLGLGRCNFDCVSYCTKGCQNYIDLGVGVDLGAHLQGLVGLCILPDVVLVVNKAKVVVTVVVKNLLCLVGGLLNGLLGIFNCNCASPAPPSSPPYAYTPPSSYTPPPPAAPSPGYSY
ncbi:hypothetical protein HIM_04194 [Hirsutella minnesotensis 3608]|uniref:Uncharacterized protein n=1 Tax=Hirsutella minnesotensis 3608 TaxID=1043627 RepID=A0A0F7ZQ16_9HYPO|nr:hypothetical protein HIM_04194 [Hirsutella minnesotensis 3608]